MPKLTLSFFGDGVSLILKQEAKRSYSSSSFEPIVDPPCISPESPFKSVNFCLLFFSHSGVCDKVLSVFNINLAQDMIHKLPNFSEFC
jgi:hypothetical protein